MSKEKVLTLRGKRAVWAPAGDGDGPIDPKRLPEGYPYKEGGKTVIEWDGNAEGKVNVGDGLYTKVSDLTPSVDELKPLFISGIGSYEDGSEPNEEYDDISQNLEQELIYSSDEVIATVCFAIVYKDNVSAAVNDRAIVFPEKGLYFGNYYHYGRVGYMQWGKETIHTMSPEFLPKTTVRVTLNEDDMSATCDMTYAEINALVNSGDIVKVELSMPLGVLALNYCGCDINGTLSFCTPWVLDPYNSTGIDVFFVSISEDEYVDFKWFKATGTW